MLTLITAKQSREKTDNYIDGNNNLISAMKSIRKSYSKGSNKCDIDFYGYSKDIDNDIETIKNLGYTISNMDDPRTDEEYEVRSFTILW